LIAGEPKVFISYRREETAGHAGRLYDVMSSRFGDANVFMDVDIAPGVDFVQRITQAVGTCHVLLVIIGPRWATISDGGTLGRIFEPGDFVRLEVEEGLRSSGVAVIPVLVGGARMPAPGELPAPLRALSRRNAIELSDTRWRYDVERLLAALDGLLAGTSAVRRQPPAPRPARVHGPSLALGVLVGAAVAGLVGRAIADQMRWGPKTQGGKVLQPVLLQGFTWALVGAVVALWLVRRGRDPRPGAGAVFAGALIGLLAGAGTAAIKNIPTFLIHPTPADSALKALSVIGLGVTGALIGALVGWLWDRRASAGLVAGLLAGAVLQLVLNAVSWHASRPVYACVEAGVIVGSVALVQILMDMARSPRALAASGGP
jgi:hypothetical protein